MKRKINLWCVPLVALALLAGACAGTRSIPEGYDVSSEVRLVQISAYLDSLRSTYVTARQQQVITRAQFITAVKADTKLTRAWNKYVELVRVEQDSPEWFWHVVGLVEEFERSMIEMGLELAGEKPAYMRR